MPRRIAHLDMNAYYVSIELLRYPQLKGLPVVVGGRRDAAPQEVAPGQWHYVTLRDYVGRGVVTTSTYEARALGVHSGMGMMKSAKLAPDAIVLPADFNAYRHYSRLFKQAVIAISPHMQDVGIDEIYLDLTDIDEETETLAQRLKDAVRQATGLTCSIGIAPNKLLAKICSDLQKPDGMTIISAEDVPSRIWPLNVSKINGIGPKAVDKLKALGIETIGQLAHADPGALQDRFGRSYSAWLLEAANGIDDRPVRTWIEPKQVSRETTFDRDLHARHDREELSGIFTSLCERVAADLRKGDYVGRTIGIKLRFADFQTITRDQTAMMPTDDAAKIRRTAGECLRRVPLDKRIRLLGVRVSGLEKKSELQLPLYEQQDLFQNDKSN